MIDEDRPIELREVLLSRTNRRLKSRANDENALRMKSLLENGERVPVEKSVLSSALMEMSGNRLALGMRGTWYAGDHNDLVTSVWPIWLIAEDGTFAPLDDF